MMRRANVVTALCLGAMLPLGCSSSPGGGNNNTKDPNCADPMHTSNCSNKSQYIIDNLFLPSTATAATKPPYALKLDGDPNNGYDNALGQLLAALAGQGFNFQTTIDAAISTGQVIMLWQYYAHTAGFPQSDSPDGLQAFLGMPASGTMCNGGSTSEAGGSVDGSCNFFGGMGMFDIAMNSPANAFAWGGVSGGLFQGQMGGSPLIISFPFGGGPPLTITLYGAKVSATPTANRLGDPSSPATYATVGGAIKLTDLNTTLIPAIAGLMNNEIALGGATAMTILSLFDGDCACTTPAPACIYSATSDCECAADNKVSPQEVLQNPIIKGTLEKPDLNLFDASGNYAPLSQCQSASSCKKDSLSLGLAFTATKAIIVGAP